MSWKTDGHGLAVSGAKLKIYESIGHSWAMKLTPVLTRTDRKVLIATYSITTSKMIVDLLSKRSKGVHIICHEMFRDAAIQLKGMFPDLNIATHSENHAKMVLVEDKTVYLGSCNFVSTGWHDTVVGIKSKTVYDFYQEVWKEIRTECTGVSKRSVKSRDYSNLKTGGGK